MDTTGAEYLLSQFGIKQHRHEAGQLEWTIEIVTDGATAQTQSARYDAQRGVWTLQQTLQEQPSSPQTSSESIQKGLIHPPSTANWTNAFPISPFTDVFLNLDWSATLIGPLAKWPLSLQAYTQMLLSDARPAAIYWGPKRIAIYNEASIPLIGALHPLLLGRTFEKVMPGLWEYFGPLFQALEDGEHGFARHGLEVPIARHGYVEETYWDGGLTALRDDNGNYGGTHFSWTEVTRTTLRDRRTTMINRLGNPSITTAEAFWQHVHDILQEYPRDIPMAMAYSTDVDHPSSGRLHREHAIGLGASYTAAPCELDVSFGLPDSLPDMLFSRS